MPAFRASFTVVLAATVLSCAPTPASVHPPARPAAAAPATAATAVSGRVLDDEGHPIKACVVRRFGEDGRFDLTIAVKDDGAFSVPLDPKSAIIQIHVSCTNRKGEYFVVATEDANTDVTVKLGTYDGIPSSITDVAILAYREGGVGRLASLTPKPGGFAIVAENGQQTFVVTTADGLTMLADGLFEVVDNKGFIPFDGAHLPPPGRPGTVVLRPGSVSAQLSDLLDRIDRPVPGQKPGGPPRPRDPAVRTAFIDQSKTASSPTIRKAAALASFAFDEPDTPGDADRARAKAVLNDVPPNDVLWSLLGRYAAYALGNVLRVAGEPFESVYVQRFIEEQPDVEKTGVFLYHEIVHAPAERQRAIVQIARGPRFKDTPFARQILAHDPDRITAPGKPMPDFEVAALDGRGKIGPHSFAGRPLLIDFWATWCGPCVRDQQLLHDLYYGAQRKKPAGKQTSVSGFTILSIAGDGEDAVKAFRKDTAHTMPWAHAILKRDDTKALFDKLGKSPSFPFYILVDPGGVIVASSPTLDLKELPQLVERMTQPK